MRNGMELWFSMEVNRVALGVAKKRARNANGPHRLSPSTLIFACFDSANSILGPEDTAHTATFTATVYSSCGHSCVCCAQIKSECVANWRPACRFPRYGCTFSPASPARLCSHIVTASSLPVKLLACDSCSMYRGSAGYTIVYDTEQSADTSLWTIWSWKRAADCLVCSVSIYLSRTCRCTLGLH